MKRLNYSDYVHRDLIFTGSREKLYKHDNTVERIRDDSEKRILRCSEGNRVWYQMWIDPGDMLRIELLLEGGSRTWMIELQKYYVFFYERKNGRRILGKDRVKKILDTLL